MTTPPRRGLVTIVGAGPGDPGLLTLHGRAALEAAEVVLYDHLIDVRLLDLAPPEALRISAGKRAGHAILPQDAINQLLALHAREGKRVVRLKGGDPYVFGRGGEEAAFLAELGIAFRVVPGVTSALGVAAYAGIPLTHRTEASAVALVTGHDDPSRPGGRLDYASLARFPGTLAIYMGRTRLGATLRALVGHGLDPATPAALVESGTRPSQRTVTATVGTLADAADAAGLKTPCLAVIGPGVAYREALGWFERLPLFGRTVVVTRPADEGARAAGELEALGARVILAPTVEIRPVDDLAAVDRAIDRLGEFDWLVFTSANGVRAFLGRVLERGRDLRLLGHLRLAAIGPVTAEALAGFHLRADLVPESFRSEALAEALGSHAAGRRVLLARADRGRTVLREKLEGLASRVEQVAVYRSVDAPALPDELRHDDPELAVDWITLTSPAITARLHALAPASLHARITAGHTRLASLSPVTSAAAAELGWQVSAEATTYTWEGLIAALVAAASRRD